MTSTKAISFLRAHWSFRISGTLLTIPRCIATHLNLTPSDSFLQKVEHRSQIHEKSVLGLEGEFAQAYILLMLRFGSLVRRLWRYSTLANARRMVQSSSLFMNTRLGRSAIPNRSDVASDLVLKRPFHSYWQSLNHQTLWKANTHLLSLFNILPYIPRLFLRRSFFAGIATS